jgi:hypothetical protein
MAPGTGKASALQRMQGFLYSLFSHPVATELSVTSWAGFLVQFLRYHLERLVLQYPETDVLDYLNCLLNYFPHMP